MENVIPMYKRSISLDKFLILIMLFAFFSCNKDNSVEPVKQTTSINITVKSLIDSSVVNGANVVLYNANTGESVSRTNSGADGLAKFSNISSGSFYVKIAAQDFKELPQANVSPVPFSYSAGQSYSQTYYLDTLKGVFGRIDGYVNPKQAGFLIIAASTSSSTEAHTYSGPDGYFELFNVPFDSYKVNALKSGYQSDIQPTVSILSGSPDATVQINLTQSTGSTLTGMVTFLATQNGIVDVSLLDKNSMEVINGLTTKIDTNRNYTIKNIPNGDYVAWASYQNDGYVMDPDWIFKNPSALNISFNKDTSIILNFSVTNAITIVSPTNPADSIIPAMADSVVPTFHWDAYPQAQEYIIEVRDINGNLIWGGFTASGVTLLHAQIPRGSTSVVFNFDGSASAQLQPGQIYQWKIYADDNAAPNVQTLLSSSEGLRGLFKVP